MFEYLSQFIYRKCENCSISMGDDVAVGSLLHRCRTVPFILTVQVSL